MIKKLNKRIRKLDVADIGLIKFAVAVGILFIIKIWPAAMVWVNSVNPWHFLIAFVILAARPMYRFWS